MRFFILVFLMQLVAFGTGMVVQRDTPISPQLAMLLPDGTCPAPCWVGVPLGETNYNAALNLFSQMSYGEVRPAGSGYVNNQELPLAVLYPIDNRAERIDSLYIQKAGKMRLGDVIAALGSPDYICFSSPEAYLDYRDAHFIPVFDARVINRLTPDTPITRLIYTTYTYEIVYGSCSAWHGFVWLRQ